jgi:cytochrome c556
MLGLCMSSLRVAAAPGSSSRSFARGRRSSAPRPALALAIAAIIAFGGASASAAPQRGDPEGQLVKDMVRDALVLEKAGKCKEALGLLRQAAAIRETGEVLLNVGECQSQGGALLEALKTWENAEDVARNEKDRTIQQKLSQRIEQLRARVPTILLRMPKDVAGLQVKIDDQPQPSDRITTPILVNPGEHTLTVAADGRQTFTKKLSLVERDGAVINVVLPRIGEVASVEAQPAVDQKPRPAVPLGTWIAGGATIVLAVGGVASFVAAGSAAADGKSQCAKMVTCDPSQKRQVHELDTLALGLWIGAGASAAFGVTWWVVNRPKARPAPEVGLSLTPTGGFIHGSF